MENNITNLISQKEQELADLRKYQEYYEAENATKYHNSRAEKILSLIGTSIIDIKLKRDAYATTNPYCFGDITTLTFTLSNGTTLEVSAEDQLFITIEE